MIRISLSGSQPAIVVNGHLVTDRAKRYRAQQSVEPMDRCFACGAKNPLDVHYIDGHEDNGEPFNLTRACRSCNVIIANVMRRQRMGVKTRQFNPARPGHAPSLGAYLSAIQIVKGEVPGSVHSAVKTIQGTSARKRSENDGED